MHAQEEARCMHAQKRLRTQHRRRASFVELSLIHRGQNVVIAWRIVNHCTARDHSTCDFGLKIRLDGARWAALASPCWVCLLLLRRSVGVGPAHEAETGLRRNCQEECSIRNDDRRTPSRPRSRNRVRRRRRIEREGGWKGQAVMVDRQTAEERRGARGDGR
eukprot:5315279-Pleurochrysis_carterae.AAC.3